jgi:hypothetical protein
MIDRVMSFDEYISDERIKEARNALYATV